MKQKNKILIGGNGKPVSMVLAHDEAVKRLEMWQKVSDPKSYLVETDQEVNEKPVYGPAEEVEDVGCQGGACTL